MKLAVIGGGSTGGVLAARDPLLLAEIDRQLAVAALRPGNDSAAPTKP